jgi:NADH:ubiquinone oxidoreductase subunit 4 (subunit M)
LLALIVLLGVYPQPFLGMIETSVATTLERAGFTPSNRADAPGHHDEQKATSAGAHR